MTINQSLGHEYSEAEVKGHLMSGWRYETTRYLERHGLVELPPFQILPDGRSILMWQRNRITLSQGETAIEDGELVGEGAVVTQWERREVRLNAGRIHNMMTNNAVFEDPSRPVPVAQEEDTPIPPTDSTPTRADLLYEAAASLDRNDPELFTAAGKPTIGALATLTGIADISAGERDEAWSRFLNR